MMHVRFPAQYDSPEHGYAHTADMPLVLRCECSGTVVLPYRPDLGAGGRVVLEFYSPGERFERACLGSHVEQWCPRCGATVLAFHQ